MNKTSIVTFLLIVYTKENFRNHIACLSTEQVCVSNVNNQADSENGFLRSGFDYNFEHGEDTVKNAMEWAGLMRMTLSLTPGSPSS